MMKRILILAILWLSAASPALAAGPWFVDSHAVGTADCLSWANACLTTGAAGTKASAGDTIYIGDDSAETAGVNTTITFPGTPTSINNVLCVDHTKASPGAGDLKTTCSISTTGATGLTFIGSWYGYGLILTAGSSGVTSNLSFNGPVNVGGLLRLDNSSLVMGSASTTSSAMNFGTGTGTYAFSATLNNVTTKFNNNTQGITVSGGTLQWVNTPSGGVNGAGTIPTVLFKSVLGTYIGARVWVEGVDLTAVNTTLVGVAFFPTNFYLKDNSLNAGVTICLAPTAPMNGQTYLVRSASNGTNYIERVCKYEGTQTDETTITRVGGASNGTTLISKKLVTTAGANWVDPFTMTPVVVWNAGTGSTTWNISCTWNSNSLPTNAQIWLDAEYLGSNLTPLGTFTNDGAATILTSGSPLTADGGSTWNGGGSGALWSPFLLTVTGTVGQVGYVYLYIKAAAASQTFYCDPLVH